MTRRNSGRNYSPPSTQATATFLSCPFEPLALIEYLAVDPDYDGKVFRSVWQGYRGNTANDEDALRVVTQAVVTTPLKAGPRKVCVRVVDVFGFEAEVVATVGAA